MRSWFALLVALPALAFADRANPDDGPPPPAARLASVRGTLDGSIAIITVRYELAARGPMLWRDSYHLDVPPAGTVIGATAFVGGVPHPLELRAASETGSALDELGDRAPTGSLPWTFAVAFEPYHSNQIELDVGVPRVATIAVELAVQVPACFYRDARYAMLDVDWVPRAAHAIRSSGTSELDRVCGDTGDDPEHEPHAWLRFGDDALARRAGGEPRISSTADRLALPSTEIVRVELDVAATLAAIPDDLYTAIVIDNSRSVDTRSRWEQAALVASYLDRAPAGHVQVIAYDRHARALLPSWAIAASARAMIAKSLRLLDEANGSNLDIGLAEAERWLAGVTGTRRIIAFSDEQLPIRIDTDKVVVPTGILVHTIKLTGRDAVLVRDDNSLLARIADHTEGVGFSTRSADAKPVDATVLVRPIEFENVAITSPGRTEISGGDINTCTTGQSLAQGQSCAWWATGGDAPVHVTGKIWGHAIDRELALDDAHAIQLARGLVGNSLDDKLQADVDVAARAVDPAWSLLATWGGDGGYAERVYHGIGTGMFGCGCGGGGIGGYARDGVATITTEPLVTQLERAASACAIPDGGVGAELELTDDEIVEVEVTAPDAVKTCVTEAIWGANVIANHRGHHTLHVDLHAR